MAFKGCVCFWHVTDNSVWSSCCKLLFFFGLLCAGMLGLYEHHSSNAVGHTCLMWKAYFVQGDMPVMLNLCVSVLLVTLLIALGLHEAYKLT